MPMLNGIEFVEQLRSLQPQIPIIFITGYLSAISDKKIVDELGERSLPSRLSLVFYGLVFTACSTQLPTQHPKVLVARFSLSLHRLFAME